MFEAVCLGRTLSKSDFKEQENSLREKLLDAQFSLKEKNKTMLGASVYDV